MVFRNLWRCRYRLRLFRKGSAFVPVDSPLSFRAEPHRVELQLYLGSRLDISIQCSQPDLKHLKNLKPADDAQILKLRDAMYGKQGRPG